MTFKLILKECMEMVKGKLTPKECMMERDEEAWHAVVHGVAKSQT